MLGVSLKADEVARALLLQMGSEEAFLMYIPPQPVHVQFGESQIQFSKRSNPNAQDMPMHGGAIALDMSQGPGVTRTQESLRLQSPRLLGWVCPRR